MDQMQAAQATGAAGLSAAQAGQAALQQDRCAGDVPLPYICFLRCFRLRSYLSLITSVLSHTREQRSSHEMSPIETRRVDGVITSNDRDHFKCRLLLCVVKSNPPTVRTYKRESKRDLSVQVHTNGSPLHFFSFFLILRGCGSFSTLSVFLGIRMTGTIGVTLTFSPLPSSSRSVLLPSKSRQSQKAAQGNALRPLQQNGSCHQRR